MGGTILERNTQIIMDSEYLVSVIIPVYNAELYLTQCIDSVLNQTYDNLEIILVDDGSFDECPEICDEYVKKDSRIAVIHQGNKGVSAARNAGIEYSHGDYITFVDSDDELYPEAIKILINDAVSYNADISSAVKCTIKKTGEIINIYEDNKYLFYEGIDSICMSLDGDRQTNSSCAKLYKKSFLGNVRFTEGRSINEDGFFLFQCYEQQPRIVQHNVCVYKYYVRENSASREEFSEKHLDMLYFCQRKKEIIHKNFPNLKDKVINMEVSTNLFFLEAICRTNKKNYKKYEKDSIKTVKELYRNYRPIHKHEMQLSKIVAFGLFPVYKLLIKIRIKFRELDRYR